MLCYYHIVARLFFAKKLGLRRPQAHQLLPDLAIS